MDDSERWIFWDDKSVDGTVTGVCACCGYFGQVYKFQKQRYCSICLIAEDQPMDAATWADQQAHEADIVINETYKCPEE